MNVANSPAQGIAPTGQTTQLQLHDIHLPEQVSNFPIALGWWILLVIVLVCSFWLFKKFKKDRLLNAKKNQALAALKNNPELNANDCINLLKWAAMQYFSREQLAKLYGDNLQQFLQAQLPTQHQHSFNTLSIDAFQAQYQSPDCSSSEVDKQCQQATKLWLTHALPVKNLTANPKELS